VGKPLFRSPLIQWGGKARYLLYCVFIFIACGSLPVTVTTRIITCLVKDSKKKPFFATVNPGATDLVGGFNPSEKYARQIGNLPQIGVNIKLFELPPPSDPIIPKPLNLNFAGILRGIPDSNHHLLR